MRRDLLIAFAGGAALSAAISVAAFMAIPLKIPERPVLILYDKGVPLEDLKADEANSLTAGRLMHSCGAKDFAVKIATGTDRSNYIEAPLSDENLFGITCALKSATVEGFDFSLAPKKLKNAQTH